MPANGLVEVSCRTVQGRLLLTPKPEIAEVTRGVVARAAPLVHAASMAVRHSIQAQYRRFVEAFRFAATRWRARGTQEARLLFPEGSFPPFAPFVSLQEGG